MSDLSRNVAARFTAALPAAPLRSVSSLLRSIAAAIDASAAPSRSRTASAIACLLLATDKSLALTVRSSLVDEISSVVPGEFGVELYDTNPDGKGFREGYMSFGLDPNSWENDGIIGGILIQCTYNPSMFKSEEPDAKHPSRPGWKGHSQSGGLIQMGVTACYYNKLRGGGCAVGGAGGGAGGEEGGSGGAVSGPVSLGPVDVLVDAQEKVVDIQVDAATMSRELKKIIADILANPPDYAQSEDRKRKSKSPTGSPQSLLKWLVANQRKEVNQSELEALARAMSLRSGGSYVQTLEKVTDFFTSRHWAVSPKAASPAA